jgi:anti-anti-sigma factor
MLEVSAAPVVREKNIPAILDRKEKSVELQTEELESGTTKINLIGKLDIEGTQAVDLKFTALTAARGGFVITDLSQVSFLASIGIRMLVSNAKALRQRRGKMVLYNPQPHVDAVLKAAGIDTIIETFSDLNQAREALRVGAS